MSDYVFLFVYHYIWLYVLRSSSSSDIRKRIEPRDKSLSQSVSLILLSDILQRQQQPEITTKAWQGLYPKLIPLLLLLLLLLL
jgi:hypothetical protein